ncbi:hypothetical protein HPB48_023051 [Haemaphysalis longicornis]|uniref:Uncharacterized protein n=1 Tax=Haemaphysalis longicornis TaxID=44386 RepID=A0A9J6H3U3_HAELO|nr:hypothetical protein HPB48_023051 [Haemaphysalis longicornis]
MSDGTGSRQPKSLLTQETKDWCQSHIWKLRSMRLYRLYRQAQHAHLVILMVSAVATGPFVGLLLLAVAFPFVHSKGAGISTLIMLILQLVVMWQAIHSGTTPPRMPVTLDYCPVNSTYLHQAANHTDGSLSSR